MSETAADELRAKLAMRGSVQGVMMSMRRGTVPKVGRCRLAR